MRAISSSIIELAGAIMLAAAIVTGGDRGGVGGLLGLLVPISACRVGSRRFATGMPDPLAGAGVSPMPVLGFGRLRHWVQSKVILTGLTG
jgi:hypothetical protein